LGIELAWASADMLCAGVAEHMVPEGLDGLCEKITDFLRKSGGSASQREVYRSVRRQIKRPGDLEAAINYLTTEERIKADQPPDGRSGRVLKLLHGD
jgi:hypothetical protein